ncbi:MAG: IS5/IS1182 family transposase, partial [Streptococcus salivarius]|nr:IS5/IS1182 family transposase [Streptococcus salivarius]
TYNFTPISQYYWIIGELGKNIKKTNIKNDVCLHSEADSLRVSFCYFSSCSCLR